MDAPRSVPLPRSGAPDLLGYVTASALAVAALAASAPATAQQPEPATLSELEARSIGPAGMSGRVADVEVVPGNERVIYVGSATGGVWKSTDGGHTWRPIFDDQPASSIGAVAVHPQNPDLVWVGTGEANPRNSAGVGRGLFRSRDGGESWTRVGLEESERIARIVVHPDDPNVAWVAATGSAYEAGGHRGVYRTTDGGESWERVLSANRWTGAADLVADPENPSKLLAALWQYRRWPHHFDSGGPGSGLYLTHDGGDSWRELTPEDGLPEGELGRIGLAIHREDPRIVYALVEAERSELLRSEDGGRSWETVSRKRGVSPRPFYYADIRVDPSDENRVYRLAGRVSVSEDGGESFRTVVPSRIVHGDVHELWIDPSDPRRLILGSDGGVFFSKDRGESWRFAENLPLAQFYEISTDRAVPYHVYGGMQDNGSWFGPSEVWRERGIMNPYWMRVGGGDGFGTLVDRSDPAFGYSTWQRGNLYRFHKATGASRGIKPSAPSDTVELRFSWNAPLAHDPFNEAGLYFGSQFVHHTTDQGRSWEVISPDLTTDSAAWQRQEESGGLTKDVTGAENYTTIYTLAPSPVNRNVIWAGTDDGNVQVTRDGGDSWRNVQDEMPDKPRHGWVSHIDASPHDAAVAFAAVHDYMRGDGTTYLYRTRDYGRSWTRLPSRGVDGFARVIEQDPVVPDLLYAGTEFGLFLSLDGGESWMKWTHGLPTVPVRDLEVQPDEHDLVVGTHGRGAYVLDDIRPLRELARTPGLTTRRLHLFPPTPAVQHAVSETRGYRSTGHTMFMGDDPPYGARITYWSGGESRSGAGSGGAPRERAGGGDGAAPAGGDGRGGTASRTSGAVAADSVTIRLLSADGDTLRTLRGPADRGLHRVAWDLEREAYGPEDTRSRITGPEVPPGRYRVEVSLGDSAGTEGGDGARGQGASAPVTRTAGVTVRLDPEAPFDRADREEKYRVMQRVGRLSTAAGRAERRLGSVREGLERVMEAASEADTPRADSLKARAGSLRAEADSLRHRIFEPRPCQGICTDTTVMSTLRSAVFPLFGLDAPTGPQLTRLERARTKSTEALRELNAFLEERIRPFRDRVREAGLAFFAAPEPVEIPGAGGG